MTNICPETPIPPASGSSFAIVGSGIIGLETARALVADGAGDITVLFDRPADCIVSNIAAGLIEPVAGPLDPAGAAFEQALFGRSLPVWQMRSAADPDVVIKRTVIAYRHDGLPTLPFAPLVDDYRELPVSERHPLYRRARATSFSTYVVDTPRFTARLRAELVALGVRFEQRHLTSLSELKGYDGIINAAGLRAATLADDHTMMRGDGHIVRVRRPAGVDSVFMEEARPKHVFAADPFKVNMLYIIPRRDDLIIGGTLWDSLDVEGEPALIPGMADHLLALAGCIDQRLIGAEMLDYRAGGRPRRRAGTRIEADLSGPTPVIHCYGHGGSGWTLAPASADQTIALLRGAAGSARTG